MSADQQPTPSGPEASTSLAKSLEERLTIPDTKSAPNPKASTFTPGKFSWADEAETPTEIKKVEPPKSDLPQAQVDGASAFMNGSEQEAELLEPEFDVNVKLADQQDDPNNPLYSVKSFEALELREELLRGLATMGFRKPSKIQERALPLLLKNPPQNFIGQSQSGTGKTAAFVLNMLSRVDPGNKAPQCLVLAPTRELAKQIAGVATLMGAFLAPKGLVIVEAIPQSLPPRGTMLQGQIIVGTPGTVMDVIQRKRQLDVRQIKVLTLDEADNMLDLQGMGDQCKRVKQMLPKTIQTVLFSATFPPAVLEFAGLFAPNANSLTLEVQTLTVKGIKQLYLDCNTDQEKYEALVKFYGLMTIASSIIFVQRRDTAQQIEERMTSEGHKVASLTGALDGQERDVVFERFRNGDAKVLITTNVLARGIDVQSVTMVVNYDLPMYPDRTPDFETYLHRIGRTGRFGRTGVALSLVSGRRDWASLESIGRHFGVQPMKLDTNDWDEVEKLVKKVMKNDNHPVATKPAAEEDMPE